MVSKWFPNVTTSGQQYNIGEKPSVILYNTYINHHAGTPKPQSRNTVSPCVYNIFLNLRVPDYSNMVLEKHRVKVTSIIVNIIGTW